MPDAFAWEGEEDVLVPLHRGSVPALVDDLQHLATLTQREAAIASLPGRDLVCCVVEKPSRFHHLVHLLGLQDCHGNEDGARGERGKLRGKEAERT